MSVTVANIRGRIMSKLKALDGRRPIDRVYLDQELRDAYLDIQARLPGVYSYTASAGTISANTATFTLPTASNTEYRGDIRVQLVSDGQFLEKLHQDEMQALRNGGTGTGRPRYFAPYEDSSQQVVCWVWPMANTDESYNLFRVLAAADFSSTDIAGTTLTLSRQGAQALILKTCAGILLALDEEDVKLRKLNQRTAEKWERDGERLLYREEGRLHDIESVGRILRMVS